MGSSYADFGLGYRLDLSNFESGLGLKLDPDTFQAEPGGYSARLELEPKPEPSLESSSKPTRYIARCLACIEIRDVVQPS